MAAPVAAASARPLGDGAAVDAPLGAWTGRWLAPRASVKLSAPERIGARSWGSRAAAAAAGRKRRDRRRCARPARRLPSRSPGVASAARQLDGRGTAATVGGGIAGIAVPPAPRTASRASPPRARAAARRPLTHHLAHQARIGAVGRQRHASERRDRGLGRGRARRPRCRTGRPGRSRRSSGSRRP